MSEEPKASRSELPPLRIHHLMAWMAVTAVLISGVLWFDRTLRNGPPIENGVVIGALVVFAIAVSGALWCAGWGFYWRRRGYAFPVEPGEWLVALVAATAVGFAAVTIFSLAVFFLISHDPFPFVWTGSRILLLVGLTGTSLYVLRRRCDTTTWRILFFVLATLPLIVWSAGAIAASLLTLMALLAAALYDRRQRIARHWVHWFGIGVLAMIVLSCGVISLIPTAEHWQATVWLR